MRGMGVEDEELFWLEAEVRRMTAAAQQERGAAEADGAAADAAERQRGGKGGGGAGAGAIAIEAVCGGGGVESMPASHTEAFQRWLQPSPPSET